MTGTSTLVRSIGGDDTANVQNAIDAAEAAGGGLVFLRAGTYVVDPIVIDSTGIELVGSGRKATILQSRSGDDVIRYTGDAGSGQRLRSMTILGYGEKVAAGTAVTCVANGTTNTLKIAQNDDFQVDGYVRHPDETADADNWYRIVSMQMATAAEESRLVVGLLIRGATSGATARVISIGTHTVDIAMLSGAFQANEVINAASGAESGLKACEATASVTLTLTVDQVASAAWESGDAVTPYYGGHGIHITGVASSMSVGLVDDVDIQDVAGSAVMTQRRPASSLFSFTFRNVTTRSDQEISDHAFNICGASIGILFDQCYARKLRGSLARPTFGFRVDSHEPVFVSCNGIDSAVGTVEHAQWGLFGAEAAKDGYAASCRPMLIGCNLENWLGGASAIVCRSNAAIHARSCRWLYSSETAGGRAAEFNYSPSIRNLLEDCVISTTGSGGWDTLPLWSLYNAATGDVNVTLIRSGQTQYRYSTTNYDANLGTNKTVPYMVVTTGSEGTVGADIRRFTVQIKDANGNAATGRFLVYCWQSATSNTAAVGSDAVCAAETLTSGVQLQSIVQDGGGRDLFILAMTDATGKIEWDITVTGAGARYMQFAFAGQQTQNYATWAA